MITVEDAAALVETRNYRAAAAALATLPQPTLRALRLTLRCSQFRQDFPSVLELFDRLSVDHQADPSLRHMAVAAAANLNERARLNRLVRHVLVGQHAPADTLWLTEALRYGSLLEPRLRDAILDRILAEAAPVADRAFSALVTCGDQLATLSRWQDLEKLMQTLSAAEPQGVQARQLRLLQAQASFRQGRPAEQYGHVNAVLSADGCAPIGTDEPSLPLACSRIVCDLPLAPRRGPLVSVIIPAFNAAATIGYALSSILAQSYRDLEIIVIDDGSGDATAARAGELAQTDTRVRLIRNRPNRGAYTARNVGLAVATGVFVTTQDADDWAHPEKIARLVDSLERQPARIGALAYHIRCCEDRGLRSFEGFLRPDASSLMVRRELVLARIGYFDSVRVGADSEFQLRLERAFGRDCIQPVPQLLSFVHWSPTTLSGASGPLGIDGLTGIMGAVRREYRRAFCEWHESAEDLRIAFPLFERPFPVPNEILPD